MKDYNEHYNESKNLVSAYYVTGTQKRSLTHEPVFPILPSCLTVEYNTSKSKQAHKMVAHNKITENH